MDNDPIPSGILPTRLLLPKVRSWRLEQFIMVAGMFLVKELLRRCSSRNLKRRPISGGISPENELLENQMTLRKLRFPMEGDNVPIKPPFERFKWVTLWW
ncbi:hypothetical protein HanXRQr2_Chr07g0315171 [Helianthus annuus]|uniref:Uncharacterized protein n=1 Tax=Helianthus annuus TaxID=4232 RepID=A0A9K3NHW5_HELAN|nr:hypothetical protein HanXRQr2_Chr07g0315171 [Helianthus annuus]